MLSQSSKPLSKTYREVVNVPDRAQAPPDILIALDNALLEMQRKARLDGYDPLWNTVRIETTEEESEDTSSITAITPVFITTHPPTFRVSVLAGRRG